jgi:hypothetical protein
MCGRLAQSDLLPEVNAAALSHLYATGHEGVDIEDRGQ